jgi:hypothetical protein
LSADQDKPIKMNELEKQRSAFEAFGQVGKGGAHGGNYFHHLS